MNNSPEGAITKKRKLDPVSNINHLPTKLLYHILDFFQNSEESYFVKLVCTKWRTIIFEKRRFSVSDITNYFAREGNITALNWFKNFNFPLHKNSNIYAYAAEGGCIEMLNFLKDNGCPFSVNSYNWAAYAGQIEAIKWLRENGCHWDYTTCIWAAKGGQLNVLKWLRENGCPWKEDTITTAINNRHFDIVDWAIKNGCHRGPVLTRRIKEKKYLTHYLISPE